MKQFELKAFGLEDLKSDELVKTEGGSLLALAAIVLVGALVAGCSCSVNVNVNSPKNGGTDVDTDVEVSVV